jgi:hypothetical protein
MARRWSAIACAGTLACVVLAACGQAATPVARHSQPSSGPIAANLPDGVCAPTYKQLSDPNATRIEAKLVTRDTLMKSDPDFPPTWRTGTTYFWVVAELGTFTVDGPLPPGETPPTLHVALSYLAATIDPNDPESVANPCRGIGVTGSGGFAWPAWFDQMTAIDDVKIR